MDLKRISGIKRVDNFLGNSVISQNPNVILELWSLDQEGRVFGVKNSCEIGADLIEKLKSNGYVWNTLDSSSDRGRALDLKLLNPITGKLMVGSSSGTAINVLYGLNDIGVGTDGGGSVLAPAISLNLYSALCSGIGLKGVTEKKSTDNLSFTPGIGFIAGEFKELERVAELFIDNECEKYKDEKILITDEIEKFLTEDFKNSYPKYESTYVDGAKLNSREEMIQEVNNLFDKSEIFIYLEKNIELEGIGDTVFGCMGEDAAEIQKKSGKGFLKILNMVDASALTIPTKAIGTSIVIVGKKGMKNFREIFRIGKLLNKEYRPELYRRYFLNYPLSKIDDRNFL